MPLATFQVFCIVALAIAYALDRERIAREAPAVPTEPLDFIIEAFSPTLTVPGVSSSATTTSPRRELIVTGPISSTNTPSATAPWARVADSVANASMASRVN